MPPNWKLEVVWRPRTRTVFLSLPLSLSHIPEEQIQSSFLTARSGPGVACVECEERGCMYSVFNGSYLGRVKGGTSPFNSAAVQCSSGTSRRAKCNQPLAMPPISHIAPFGPLPLAGAGTIVDKCMYECMYDTHVCKYVTNPLCPAPLWFVLRSSPSTSTSIFTFTFTSTIYDSSLALLPIPPWPPSWPSVP